MINNTFSHFISESYISSITNIPSITNIRSKAIDCLKKNIHNFKLDALCSFSCKLINQETLTFRTPSMTIGTSLIAIAFCTIAIVRYKKSQNNQNKKLIPKKINIEVDNNIIDNNVVDNNNTIVNDTNDNKNNIDDNYTINNSIININNLIEHPVDQKFENPDQLFSFDSLPEEVALKIFSHLSFNDLARCSLVNKDWKRISRDDSLWKKKFVYKEIAFGNDKWARCFGDDVVKDENMDEEFSSLPWNIAGILESRCPIFPGNKIKDTHMLVRLPKTLNGGLTLKSLGELAKKYFQDSNSDTGYRNIFSCIVDVMEEKPIDTSRWVLMTKDVLLESREKSYGEQQKIVAELAEKSLISYEVPETLEAVACIFAQYFGSNIRLFNDDPWTYTRCKENIDGYQIIVGGLVSAGLYVNKVIYDCDDIGVAALRKFF